jgi:hypothetical protein
MAKNSMSLKIGILGGYRLQPRRIFHEDVISLVSQPPAAYQLDWCGRREELIKQNFFFHEVSRLQYNYIH